MGSLEAPDSLRSIAHYVKIANENAARDPVIYYWCVFYAVENGVKIDKKSPEALNYLQYYVSKLEDVKKKLAGQEAISQEIVAQAHVENYAMKLFEFADKNDRQGNFSKNVVKAFYTAGHLIDVLTMFGKLDESLIATRKYAKWKATYIHNCLKNGVDPVPGPAGVPEEGIDLDVPQLPPENTLPDSGVDGRSAAGSAHPSGPERPTAPARVLPPPQHDVNVPSASSSAIGPSRGALTAEEYLEAQKLAKYAVSALSYEDAKTAVENMQKAIAILTKYG